MTVKGTHAIYQKMLLNISLIKDQMMADILENARENLKNARQRRSLGNVIKRRLTIYNIKFYPDLTSFVTFADRTREDQIPKEIFFAFLDCHGDFIKSGLSEL